MKELLQYGKVSLPIKLAMTNPFNASAKVVNVDAVARYRGVRIGQDVLNSTSEYLPLHIPPSTTCYTDTLPVVVRLFGDTQELVEAAFVLEHQRLCGRKKEHLGLWVFQDAMCSDHGCDNCLAKTGRQDNQRTLI